MDFSTIGTVLAPGLALVISVITLVLAQNRTRNLDASAAARDTVEYLKVQNELLHTEVLNLHERLATMEKELILRTQEFVNLKHEFELLKTSMDIHDHGSHI